MDPGNSIKYRAGYKYQLAEDTEKMTKIIGYSVKTQFIKLYVSGLMRIKSGYAWDGPSGIAFDTPDFMRGSLYHDAGYELLRKELLPQSERPIIDSLLMEICLEDGMPEFRADYVFHGVSTFGGKYADPGNKKKILIAP